MKEAGSWIEISLEVDGELAEAVADVLSRYIPSGVVIESLPPANPGPQAASGEPLRIYGYIPDDERAAEVRRQIETGLWYLGRIRPLPEPAYRLFGEEDWSQYWKRHFTPVRVGERLLVQPSWAGPPVSPERIPVLIDPGMAFGTGTHPSTSLSLELIEGWIRPGAPMIDVGCGSGILAVAAIKLGASRALGVDIDPQAVKEAEKNARINRVEDRLEFGIGSVLAVLEGKFSIKNAPLVVANIVAPALQKLVAQGLDGLRSDGGVIVLSGMLAEQEGQVVEAAGGVGLEVAGRRQEGDWVALVLR